MNQTKHFYSRHFCRPYFGKNIKAKIVKIYIEIYQEYSVIIDVSGKYAMLYETNQKTFADIENMQVYKIPVDVYQKIITATELQINELRK
jgi:hypothetical protein